MDIQEFEDMLAEVLPIGFKLVTNKNGQIIVYTGMSLDEDGEVVDFESDDDDEDLEVDPDMEPLEEEDDEDD